MLKTLSIPLKLFLGAVACLSANPVLSQVTSDNTVNTQINQNANVSEITEGEARGSNLFHSFQDFSIPTGNEAFFNNSNAIENIFSRVTGGNISNIDGVIRANGSASLFLINPNGIVFGENSSLNIGGSFYASSASSILFEEGEFSAVDNLAEPILTINAPIGLGFRDNPGDITLTSNAVLTISPGETLGLVGGNVSFLDNGGIIASDANVELGGLAETGIVAFEDNILSSKATMNRANISISNGFGIFLRGNQGGSLGIYANNFKLVSGSFIFAGIGEGLGTPETQAGDIRIDVRENFDIDSEGVNGLTGLTGILNANSGVGNLGDIIITANNISFNNGGNITVSNFGQGNIGALDISAAGNIVFDGTAGVSRSGIQNIVLESGGGDIAATTITAQNLSVTNGGQIDSSVGGTANSGDINLNIADTINITGRGEVVLPDGTDPTQFSSNISTVLFPGGTGNAGDININTQNLSLSNNGQIDASNFAQGNAGDINITAKTIDIQGGGDNTASFSSIASEVFGDFTANLDAFATGGNIQVETESLSIRDGGSISTSNGVIGNGNGGNVKSINY